MFKKHVLRLLFFTLSVISIFNTTKTATAQLTPSKKLKIGLLIVATGKYIEFVEPLLKSADKYFFPNHDVTYFVFTDGKVRPAANVVSIYQEKLAWPYATMMRFGMYADQKNLLKTMDYLYACDADLLFVDTVADEIVSQRVGTLSPGYVGKKGTPETRLQSTAYIKPGTNRYYYAGGFCGGTAQEFLKLAQTIKDNVAADQKNGIIAVWHDESHLNRYLLTNEPTLVLSPSYCYPGYSDSDPRRFGPWYGYPKKILVLVKDHAQYQV